jgi:predicted DNA-binding WGR domain protein
VRYESYRQGRAFVDVHIDGCRLLRTWGEVGHAPAGSRSSSFESELAAERAAEAQHRRLLKVGYWPGRHNLKMIRTLQRDPTSAEVRARYLEWLEEVGEPRAALIRAQTEIDRLVVLQRHPTHLFPTGWEEWFTVSWVEGFIEEAIFSPGRLRGKCAAGVLARFLNHPSSHLLRSLTLAGPTPPYGPGVDWANRIAAWGAPTIEWISTINKGVFRDLAKSGIRVEYTPQTRRILSV